MTLQRDKGGTGGVGGGGREGGRERESCMCSHSRTYAHIMYAACVGVGVGMGVYHYVIHACKQTRQRSLYILTYMNRPARMNILTHTHFMAIRANTPCMTPLTCTPYMPYYACKQGRQRGLCPNISPTCRACASRLLTKRPGRWIYNNSDFRTVDYWYILLYAPYMNTTLLLLATLRLGCS